MAKAVVATMIVLTIQAVNRLPLALPTGREEPVRRLVGRLRTIGGDTRTDEALDLGVG